MTFEDNEFQRRRRESRAFWNAFLQFWEHLGNRVSQDNFGLMNTGVDLTPSFLCDGCGQYVYDGGCGCGQEVGDDRVELVEVEDDHDCTCCYDIATLIDQVVKSPSTVRLTGEQAAEWMRSILDEGL